MFEKTFKNIDNILFKDAGCSSELDYIEQTSWILFLKYMDDLEKDKKTAAELSGKTYTNIIAREYQWTKWAMPKGKDGKLDHHKALTGDDLKDFVDLKLFPYFKKFKADAESADTIEYKIGEIFSELKNKIQSGYNLREVINRIDELRFRTRAEKHEMSHLYESKIQNMGNAGRNGGEYYTPRPLIKTIVKVVAPKIGDKIYDGALGSAGFHCEAFEYLKHSKGKPENLTSKDIGILQKKTFYGKEKKSLAYIIGTMNMILHGVEAPNIVHTNTLAENLADIQEKDRYDVVLANPPFGGKERAEVQQNFPIKTGETAFLFLQHFIKILKAGGRAGVVIKNTFLSNTDNASVSLRKLLLENCNLHTVLDLPGGTFTGAGVKTVVLFFEKGAPTRKVWFYELNLVRNLGKTNPLSENDLAEFVDLQKTFAGSKNSWTIDVKNIDQITYDLSTKNPNKKKEKALRQSRVILKEMKLSVEESTKILNSLVSAIEYFESYLQSIFDREGRGWEKKRLGEICKVIAGQSPEGKYYNSEGRGLPFYQGKKEFTEKYLGEPTTWTTNITKEAEENDILMSVRAPVGPINFSTQQICIGRGLAAIRAGNMIDNKFLFYFLLKQENKIIGNAGAVFNSINKAQIETIEIPLPPLRTQRTIVQKLDLLSAETKKLKSIYQQKIDGLEELKKSVLQKAFNGEL